VDYDWPGNVRELQNVIERAVLIAEGKTIQATHLPEGLKKAPSFLLESLDQALSIENYTKEFIQRYESSMNEQKLADLLGITRKALWEKRKKWGLLKKT
jgi:transcriptional regulator with PAS, ATPase and Fis domain